MRRYTHRPSPRPPSSNSFRGRGIESFTNTRPAPAIAKPPSPPSRRWRSSYCLLTSPPSPSHLILLQIAFVAGLGAELATGESFTSQFSAHTGSIAFAAGLITLASFMPNLQNADAYKANPSTLKTSGPWNIDAERANGRAAMVGLVAMLVLEKAIGGPVTGLLGDDSSGPAVNYYDDSFKSSVVASTPPPAAAPASGFVDFYAAAPAAAPAVTVAPVVAEEASDAVVEAVEAVEYETATAYGARALAAYEGEVAADPLRVEGAAAADVEQDAADMGRAADVEQDATDADAAELAAGM